MLQTSQKALKTISTFLTSAIFAVLLGCGKYEDPQIADKTSKIATAVIGLYPESELASRYGKHMAETKNQPCEPPENDFADRKLSYEHESGNYVHVWVRSNQVVREEFVNVRNGIGGESIAHIRTMHAGDSTWKTVLDGEEPIWKRKDGRAVMWPERLTILDNSYVASVSVITPNVLRSLSASGKRLSSDAKKDSWLKENLALLDTPE
jgi:hypothetical protein